MSDWWLEFILFALATFVLLDGPGPTRMTAAMRYAVVVVLAAAAVAVWMAVRYRS